MSSEPQGALSAFRFRLSGGMSGGRREFGVTALNGRKCLYDSSEAGWHNRKPATCKKKLPAELLTQLRDLFMNGRLYEKTEAPRSEVMLLDAPTACYTFAFGDTVFTFTSGYDYPDGVPEALDEACRLIAEAAR